MTNKIFTDGERSTSWGIEQTSIEQLENAGIPYIFNEENNKAIVLYDVANVFQALSTLLKIILFLKFYVRKLHLYLF